MHKLGVFHRDLKPDNSKHTLHITILSVSNPWLVLISEEGTLKLADFGWAVFDPHPRRLTLCGTLDYLPPEMILNNFHNASVDTWALGIICYELLVGKPPFDREKPDEDHRETHKRIVKANIVFPDHVSQEARHFILKLLQKDPSKRLSIQDIESDPWIKRYS